MKNIAIILAAGKSTRCGFDKLFETGVIEQTLEIFETCESVDEIVLVIQKNQELRIKNQGKLKHLISGGRDRYSSLKNAIGYLQKTKKSNCRIIVHNGANPFITSQEIAKGIEQAKKHKNVIFGYFSPNSIKKVQNGKVLDFLNREEIFETQTPQISDLETFTRAIKTLQSNVSSHKAPRDEAELLSLINEEIHTYECSSKNQKITYPHDIPPSFSKRGLGGDFCAQTEAVRNLHLSTQKPPQSSFFKGEERCRIGLGEDSHRFTSKFNPQKPLTLGGVQLPESHLSIEANSDGDVIFHALTNAILSSTGEKTLSEFSDEMCTSGITDSWEYLKKALEITHSKYPNFKIQNINISLEAKIPKLSPHHDIIQNHIAQKMKLNPLQVGLTYTSGEDLSDFGKGKGIRCLAQILAMINE